MNENVQMLMKRLARLDEFALLFQQEVKEVTQLVKTELVKQQVTDAASTTGEEMQIMLDQLNKVRGLEGETTTLASEQGPVGEAAESLTLPKSDNYMSAVFGPKSLFCTHLSPNTINEGRGFIRVCQALPQYEESVTDAPVDVLKQWPSGFYRNQVTKEAQLYVRLGNKGAFVYDGLPGYHGQSQYVNFTTGARHMFVEMMDVDRAAVVALLHSSLNLLVEENQLAV